MAFVRRGTNMARQIVKKSSPHPKLMAGMLCVEELSISEQKSRGGILLPDADPERKFDKLAFGLVKACAEQYRDFRGQIQQQGFVKNWPIPVGSLIVFKKAQAWLPPEGRDRSMVLNAHDVVWWNEPGTFELSEE
jgi:co-chaperonin GroES (HSP10)